MVSRQPIFEFLVIVEMADLSHFQSSVESPLQVPLHDGNRGVSYDFLC